MGYITINFLISQFSIVDSQTSAILTISSLSLLLSAIIIAAAIRLLANNSRRNKPFFENSDLYRCFDVNTTRCQ